jgi:mannose-6-phosphate isomerase-like protein (cupin superfamily)
MVEAPGHPDPAPAPLLAAIEEALMSSPVRGTTRSFDQPDDHVAKGGVEIDALKIGDMDVKRISYPPGWRYSTHMGAPRCFDTHVGYTVSGRLVAELEDGTRLELSPGSVFVVPAGHDGWVVGDEPCVIVQFDEGESAARRFNVEGGAAAA